MTMNKKDFAKLSNLNKNNKLGTLSSNWILGEEVSLKEEYNKAMKTVAGTTSEPSNKESLNTTNGEIAIKSKFVNPETAFEEVKRLLSDAVKDGVFPGAVVYAGYKGQLIYKGAFGQRSVRLASNPTVEPAPMMPEAVFDVGSLTSILSTTAIIMKLVGLGRLKLDERVSRYIQGFGVNGKSPITVQHLLTHTSGFPAQILFQEEIALAHPAAKIGMYASNSAKEFVTTAIARHTLKGEIGGKPVYSDLNYLVLGFLIESMLGMSLDKATDKHIIVPLRLKSTSFINLALIKHSNLHPATEIIAPTEECSWRQKLLWGEVQDDNAWTIGGVAGHAGLFSTANDVYTFGNELLTSLKGYGNGIGENQSNIFTKEIIESFVKQDILSGNKLGFESPTKENGMTDSGLSSQSFGANSATGCSLWIDPSSEITLAMMTNRIHPSRSNKKINILRPILIKSVVDAIKNVV